MAAKQYIDLADLALFKQLNDSATAQAIATAEARSLHTVAIDGTTLKFYREEEPVGSSTPAYSITLPQQDLSNYLQKIAEATADDIVTVNADGTISDSGIALSAVALSADLAAVATSGDADDVAYDNTESGLTATDVQGALDELAEATGGGVATKTVYITETSGSSSDAFSKRYGIYQGAEGSASDPEAGEKLVDIDIPKDMVVEDGKVVPVTFVEGTGGASDKLTAPIGTGGADVDVTAEIKGTGVTPTASDAGEYILLTIANASSSHLWIKATDLVDIYTSGSSSNDDVIITISNNQISAALNTNGIASAKVNYAVPDVYTVDDTVTAANYATKVAAGLYYEESGDYFPITNEPFDEGQTYYTKTAAHSETVQHALERIDSAIGGGGSVDQKIADAINALDATASQTAGADGLALSVTEVDGKITAISGSIVANTYDAYGTAAGLIADLDADLDASGTAQHSGTFVMSGVTEVDGVITSVDSVEVEAAGAAASVQSTITGTAQDTSSDLTLYGLRAYADAQASDSTEAVPAQDIRNLFSGSSV